MVQIINQVTAKILILKSEESLYGTLGHWLILWTSGFSESFSESWTNGAEKSNLYNESDTIKPLNFMEDGIGPNFYKDYILDFLSWFFDLWKEYR